MHAWIGCLMLLIHIMYALFTHSVSSYATLSFLFLFLTFVSCSSKHLK